MLDCLTKWPTLRSLGHSLRRCYDEPDCRVKPLELKGGNDSPYNVTLFVEDGNILGVDVGTTDEYVSVAPVGETWDDFDDELAQPPDEEPAFDFHTGVKITAGWSVIRRIDGETKHFSSLTGILSALNEGDFGIKLFSPWDREGPAPVWSCAKATCSSCQTPHLCAVFRDDVPEQTPGFAPPLRGEPLGWLAPELS
jgi:hypothetical protein